MVEYIIAGDSKLNLYTPKLVYAPPQKKSTTCPCPCLPFRRAPSYTLASSAFGRGRWGDDVDGVDDVESAAVEHNLELRKPG